MCGCQLTLCCFNVVFLYLSIANWVKRGQQQAAAAAKPSRAPVFPAALPSPVKAGGAAGVVRSRVSVQAQAGAR